MTVIRKGVTKLGSYTVKKVFENKIDVSDGSEGAVEKVIAVMGFPQYTHVGYGRFNIDVVGSNPKDPWNYVEMALRGSMYQGDLTNSTAITSDVWQDVLEDLTPIDPSTALSGGDATSVGITGEEHRYEGGHEFFRREAMLGLPNAAYPTAEDKVRYKYACSYKGHMKTEGQILDIANPKILTLGCTTTIPNVTNDQSTSAGGGATDWLNLYESLVDNIPAQGQVQSPGMGDSLPSTLHNYLYEGYSASRTAADDDLYIRVYMTLRLDVYAPSPHNYVPAP